MTTTPSKRAGTGRRAISLAPNVIDEAQAPAPAPTDSPAAEAAPAKPAARKRQPAAEQPPAAAKTRTRREPLPEPPMVSAELRAGEESFNEPTFKLTAQVPKSLHRRASGLIANAQMFGVPADLVSLTDLVNLALDDKITQLEREFNGGKSWPAPLMGLSRGRRPKS